MKDLSVGVCVFYFCFFCLLVGHVIVSGFLGAVLDRREVPKCQLAKTAGKSGASNIFPRHFLVVMCSIVLFGVGQACSLVGETCCAS